VAAVSLLAVLPLALPIALRMGDVPGLLDVAAWGLRGAPPSVSDEMRVGLYLWEPLRHTTGFFVSDQQSHPAFLPRAAMIPWVALPLLLLGLRRPGRLSRGAWIASFLALTLVAMGPVLLVGKIGLPNLVYIGLVKLFRPLQRLWWPGRASAFIGLLVVAGLVAGLAWIRTRWGAWAWRGALVAVALGWAAHLRAEQILPFPTWDATIPAGYRCLAQGPPGAIVELPYSWTQAHLYYQTAHGRPLLGGMIENNVLFTPPELTTLRQDNSFVARLIAITGGGITQVDGNQDVRPADRLALIDLG